MPNEGTGSLRVQGVPLPKSPIWCESLTLCARLFPFIYWLLDSVQILILCPTWASGAAAHCCRMDKVRVCTVPSPLLSCTLRIQESQWRQTWIPEVITAFAPCRAGRQLPWCPWDGGLSGLLPLPQSCVRERGRDTHSHQTHVLFHGSSPAGFSTSNNLGTVLQCEG